MKSRLNARRELTTPIRIRTMQNIRRMHYKIDDNRWILNLGCKSFYIIDVFNDNFLFNGIVVDRDV